ncbi:MAG: antibiotic biosynthesis monooxygenase [Thermodesulfobacteriota bacterium]
MLAKILIKRHFKQEFTPEVIELLHNLRGAALTQPGYISGETLTRPGDPCRMLVIGTWQSLDSWHQWQKNERRRELDAELDILLEEPATYEEYVVGWSKT